MAPGVPVFVTENGIATADDARRIEYVRGALTGLHAAIADGIRVEGYLYWSLLDNYSGARTRRPSGSSRSTERRSCAPSGPAPVGSARSHAPTRSRAPREHCLG